MSNQERRDIRAEWMAANREAQAIGGFSDEPTEPTEGWNPRPILAREVRWPFGDDVPREWTFDPSDPRWLDRPALLLRTLEDDE